MFWFSVLSSSTTRSTERSRAVIFSFDNSTRTCRRTPPATVTAATPGTRSTRRDSSVLGQLAQLDAVERAVDALDGHPHDREGVRIELVDDRRIRVLGEPGAHAIDARADLVHRLVQVVAPREVHADVADAFVRGGGDLLEAGHRAQLLLERPGEELLDLERSDAQVRHSDRDRRPRDVRQQVHGQSRQRDAPEQDDDAADHRHHDRTLDGEPRDAHTGLLKVRSFAGIRTIKAIVAASKSSGSVSAGVRRTTASPVALGALRPRIARRRRP